VGGGDEATLRDALAVLEELSGRTLRVTYGPPQTGDMRRTKGDTTRIEHELSWQASTPLRTGLAEHWKWCSARVGTA
jgi:UDP-glucose 4-epimerase